jgi:hypothetical protein
LLAVNLKGATVGNILKKWQSIDWQEVRRENNETSGPFHGS